MAEKAGIYKEYKKHFFLDETKLRKIYDVLREYSKKLNNQNYIKFHAIREDDSFYETKDIDEVLADDNTPGLSIRTLGIEMHREVSESGKVDYEDEKRDAIAFVVFQRFQEEKFIMRIQEKQRDWCFLLADDIDTQVQRTLRRKSLVSFIPPRFIDGVVLFLFLSILFFSLTYLSAQGPPELTSEQIKIMAADERLQKILELMVKKHETRDWILPISLFFWSFCFAFLGLRPISRLLKKISRSVFYWGDMIAVNDRYEKRVSHIKWGIIVAFIVSLLAGFFSDMIFR